VSDQSASLQENHPRQPLNVGAMRRWFQNGAATMPDTAKPIPPTIRGQKYISLTTFRKNGTAVATPVWFGEDAGKLYVMTLSAMGKTKRIRNNPQVRVAPCTIQGKVIGQNLRPRRASCP
jgi:predicted pyridoxine 5'-phosphate oxidase superfamily flavin-nucleotide-binding protein